MNTRDKPAPLRTFDGDIAAIIKHMRSGSFTGVVRDIAGRFDISEQQLSSLLDLSIPDCASPGSAVRDLSPSDRDRLYRAEKIWERALEIFAGENPARHWLVQPNRSLGGETPLSLLDTEPGFQLVLDTLAKIEFGIVA
jgi:putative toxin-antitoxin system antitoxin component (TIGR02293 family)